MNIDITDNLDQALADLDKQAQQMEDQGMKIIKAVSLKTLRTMMFTLAPVKTGFYRSSFRFGVNKAYTTRDTKRAAKGTQGGYKSVAAARMSQAQHEFDGKRLADIKSINISNNAPHAHLVEVGGRRNKPHGVFAAGRQLIEKELDNVQL